MRKFNNILFCLSFAVFLTAGPMALADTPCAMPKPTEIIVHPSTEEIKYDFSNKLAEIQNVQIDTENPYGNESSTTTQGFMKGGIKIKPTIKLNYHGVSRKNICMWYETIQIDVEIDPTIVIGSEVAKDKCMKAAVVEHEHKHIRVDREIVNKYAQHTADLIYATLKDAGFLYGPFPFDDADTISKAMYEQVFMIIREENAKMKIERAAAQQAVDSLEEYERVAALCPKFNPTKYLKGLRKR